MKEFDYVINGGGCAGLSLAYELNIHSELSNKTLAIIENRDEYKRDKTWSFWRVSSHNFEDCVKKNWSNFTINIPHHTKHVECKSTPYQTIDSGLFYEKIINNLEQNNNIHFFKDIKEIKTENSFIFNSVCNVSENKESLWQHFSGIEIEAEKEIFDDEIFNLMDFDCDQKDSVHFFYTLPYSKTKALVETTWISDLNDPTLNQLIPLQPSEEEALQHHWDYLYEPDARELLDGLLLRFIESQVYQAVVENNACEQAARMIAMKSASDNAGDLIEELGLAYNKARQAAITTEMLEIVGGAEALNN